MGPASLVAVPRGKSFAHPPKHTDLSPVHVEWPNVLAATVLDVRFTACEVPAICDTVRFLPETVGAPGL